MNDQVAPAETAEILRLAEQALSAAGDFVELGCYRGDTSVILGKLLAQYNNKNNFSSETALPDEASNQSLKVRPLSPRKLPNKSLWLYDSFAGLPEKTKEDSSGAGANFQAGELLVTKRSVIDKLHKHGLKTTAKPAADGSGVIVKKAWFSDLSATDLPEHIAFAFCDGDLYSSIKTSLQLVAPRLSKQGIIIVHDYNNPELPGSARAVDEFLRQHPAYKLQVRHTLAILQRTNSQPY